MNKIISMFVNIYEISIEIYIHIFRLNIVYNFTLIFELIFNVGNVMTELMYEITIRFVLASKGFISKRGYEE